MLTLATILGPTGAVLLLVALVGGGFSFSGWAMPRVGRLARVPCFVVGGVLVILAIGLAVADSSSGSTSDPFSGGNQPNTAVPAATPALGEIVAPVDIYQQPYLDAPVAGHLKSGAIVEILCTAQGDAVTNTDYGVTSSLWNGVSGGYIPDVAVDTGTDQPTMGPC